MSFRQADVWQPSSSPRTLPPGQRAVRGFPRFGKQPRRPPPPAPADPTIEVTGPLAAPLVLTPGDLAALPQVEREEDFHCVAGWSATGLRWEGVRFADLYRLVVQGRLLQGTEISHVSLAGLDGYRSVVRLDDALADDVLLATGLDGRPLTPAHGAPVRLVSPRQYGFVSTKHLCAIELHTRTPPRDQPYGVIIREHERARVWQEERHAWFPAPVIRPAYRLLARLIALVSGPSSR